MKPVAPLVVVMMGVSGSGKTTIAKGVGERVGLDVLEGDAYHPAANVAKMKSGIPLEDTDRLPWLHAIAVAIDEELAGGRSAIVACSALKRSYREILIGAHKGVVLVYLQGSPALIGQRLRSRKGHFMPPTLLQSQFDTLEEPGEDEAPIVVSIAPPPERIVDAVIAGLQKRNLIQ